MADFEYIVVGSGAGGGPLAANLARQGRSVLLLEAGGDSCVESEKGRLLYEVPIFHGLSTEFEDCRWDYFVRHYSDDTQQRKDSKLVIQDPASGQRVDAIWYPRAGTLGGCTAHNAMITVTPQNYDWDGIAKTTNDPSWLSANMNRYFERLENCQYQPRPGSVKYVLSGLLWSLIALAKRNSTWRDWVHGHGFAGWLTTSEADARLVLKDIEIIRILLKAVRFAFAEKLPHPLLGFLTKLDPNDSRNDYNMREGPALTPLAVGRGKRNGPREFLLRTAEQFPDRLKIELHALASRVLFDGRKAVAVEFLEGEHLYEADPRCRARLTASDFRKQTVSASREIILCAGAFNSPQLLKLSGIGPKAELQGLDIDVVVDLPGVGCNLQDRYEIGVVSEYDRPFLLLDGATFQPPPEGTPPDPFLREWQTGKGLYCSNGSLIGILKRSNDSLLEPDLYIFGLPGLFEGYQPGYSKLFERQRNRFTWAILKAYTENATGTVELRSKDPTKWPLIHFHSFEAGTVGRDKDLAAMVSGVKFVRRMNAALGGRPEAELCPGPRYRTDNQLREFIENEAWGHHASCSNKIGADTDVKAVLDSRFCVRGVQRLRVVDASVFPKIPGYFIVSAVYMVSEKASDVILEDA